MSDFRAASAQLPTTIKNTFNLPKLREIQLAVGGKPVCGFIEFELIKLAERINVSGNLTDAQVEFIAHQLVMMYPDETIADFKLCFEGIAIGKYILKDKLFKLDGSDIGVSMGLYLEEKYQVLESEMMKEKENLYRTPGDLKPNIQTYQRVQDYPWIFAMVKNAKARRIAWEQRWDSMARPKPIPMISATDILLEGKLKPKAMVYRSTDLSYQKQIDERVRIGREKHFRENYPGASEDDLKKYLESFEI